MNKIFSLVTMAALAISVLASTCQFAFNDCPNLTSIVIPSTYVGAFDYYPFFSNSNV